MASKCNSGLQGTKRLYFRDNDIAYLSNLYPREHAKPAEALEKLEETFHPLAMVFSENEEWLPDDGEEIILTAPPTVQRNAFYSNLKFLGPR